MIRKRYIIFIILLYLFLFDPPFFMFRGLFRFSNILIAISIIYALFYRSEIICLFRPMRKEFLLFSVLLFFVFFRSGVEGDFTYINKTLMPYLNIFLVTPAMLHFAYKSGFGSEEQIIRALLLTGTIATIITIVCLLNPSFQDYARNQILQISEEEFIFNNDYRGYGIASDHTSNYGFTLGFLSGLSCFYLKQNKWFLYCIPFMIISGLVNCRTSALIALSVILLYLISVQKKGSAFVVGFLGFLLVGYFETFARLFGMEDRTYEWIMAFYNEVVNVVESRDITASDTGSLIFGNMVIWPENMEQWLWGRGYDIFRSRGGVGNSDNGWIRQLNYGGVLFLVLFYSIMISLLHRLKRNKQWSYLFVFIIVFTITNSKTTAFPSTQIFVLLMLIYYFKVKNKKVHGIVA